MSSLAVPATAPPAPLRPSTRVVAAVVFGLFALGQAVDMISFREHWPWSPYKMYAQAKGNTHTVFEVWGVLAEPLPDGTTEVMLKPHGYVIPRASFKATYGTGKGSSRRKAQAEFDEFFAKYQKLRQRRGPSVGPELKAMRFYKITWTLLPGAPNINNPDEREVALETGQGRKARRAATQPATSPATTRSTTTTAPATRPEIAR